MSDGRNWKETIRLPKTEFAMRANLANREGDAIARWDAADLYHRAMNARSEERPFVFHDGPPYANGNIHHGHALNKILKDFCVKYRWTRGQRAMNIPGWDCHGLPIEQKVDERLGKKKREMSTVEVRRECRKYADEFVEIQREQFKRLMVLAEWERPYRTMDYSYEATTLRELGRFMEQGYVYRGLKPVHWSWAAVTALAEAEVEYAPYTAPSVYVKFDFPEPPAWMAEHLGGRSLRVVIWTTTPWTLPSNVAIVLNPDLNYQVLALNDGEAIVVAEGLKESVFAACGLEELPVLVDFEGHQLVGRPGEDVPRPEARHPFIDRASVLLPADYVTLEQGTGCVHTAPGHGQDDFATGLKYGLPVLAPVNRYGKYTSDVADYVGMHVFRANPLIAQRLEDSGHLLNKAGDTYYIDRYPHCWRTNKPLIFRATEQWFISVEHEGLRRRCLDAIESTNWVPHWGKNRIGGMMQTRPDWCISRQRSWGVPITAFVCDACGGQVVSEKVAYHVADLCEEHGSDVWFEREVAELVPDGVVCPSCNAGPDRFAKVEDILDVWFDSGVSWAAVLRDREGLDGVADLYLEGSDQHRGWFHTSLIASVANNGGAPYRSVLTHGFVVDEKGHKYSKSSPTFEPLQRMIDQHGAEILRAWVASVDYRNDTVLTAGLLKQVGDAYRKIRNTIRFLLGNLDGFDPNVGAVDPAALSPIDRWALSKLSAYAAKTTEAWEQYEFHTVFHATQDFCNLEMSAVYLDVLKDRLYCDAESDASRVGSQAVMYEILRRLLVITWPVLTFTSEEAWELMPRRDGDAEFVALTEFEPTPDEWAHTDAEFEAALALRSRVQGEIEARRPRKKGEREPGQIGSSQEALVTLTCSAKASAALVGKEERLAELFIVSRVDVVEGSADHESGVDVAVAASASPRCPRCWNYRDDVGSRVELPQLCGRCADVVIALDAS